MRLENGFGVHGVVFRFFHFHSERCKGVHCVDLGETFPTTIFLQKLASIQPRMSPPKTRKHLKQVANISLIWPLPGAGASSCRSAAGGPRGRAPQAAGPRAAANGRAGRWKAARGRLAAAWSFFVSEFFSSKY